MIRMSEISERSEGHSAGQGSESDSCDEDDIQILLSIAQLNINVNKPEEHGGTGFVYDEVMETHFCDWDANYPENPERIKKPLARCRELGLVDRCIQVQMEYATEDYIKEKHTEKHLEVAKSTSELDMEERKQLAKKFDSWYSNNNTFEASLASAGSTLALVQKIITGKLTNGFAMVRPPGHHAMEEEFNGYCTFNNVALAAHYAAERGNRVLIVDWDVHHGQGVQRMFYDDNRVLYVSIHRYEYGEFWPCLRESDYDYIGEGKGRGYNINIPLNKIRMTNSDYMAVFHQVILPIAYEFGPDLVFLASGYDAALGCPEGEMLITPAMYGHMTHHLSALSGGRIAVVLEGGYCIKSLSEGCALTLRSLLNDPCPQLPALEEPCDSIKITILNVVKVLTPYWRCFGHYLMLEPYQSCQYEEVDRSPPLKDTVFNTKENRPKEFEIFGNYPSQSAETIQYFKDEIDRLIRETNLSFAPNKCCFVFDADMRAYKNIHSSSHPERPDRISSIYTKHSQWNLLKRCLIIESRKARIEEIELIHSSNYIKDISRTETMMDEELESFPAEQRYMSVYVHQKSYKCALLSCGSLLNAVEAVLLGKAQSGVAVIRPPGHHAECDQAMGFCFFNNVAIAAKFAQQKYNVKRVLIIDWDIHHGNGTQHQFYDDPSVLYISLHRYDHGSFFPTGQEGDRRSVGSGRGKGFNVNIPWNYGPMGDAEYLAAFNILVMPIAYQFAPELVLVSAGFDAAAGDPLGGYKVTSSAYGHMTHMLSGLANGKVVLALEGGYNLHSISVSMASCTSVLLGDPCPLLPQLETSKKGLDIIGQVMDVQKLYWSCLRTKVCIPSSSKGKSSIAEKR